MNKEQELRRCPFCGGEAVLDEFENDHIIGWFGRCLECNASMPYAISKPIAVKQWNRRSSDEQAEVVGAADKLVGEIEQRFPNWRSFRDLLDCIDCTLHDLRGGAPAVAAGGVTVDPDLLAKQSTIEPDIAAVVYADRSKLYSDFSGGVTEERLEAGAKALCLATGLDWDSIPETAEGDDKDTGPETRRYFRQWFKPALTAALAVGDEGIREDDLVTAVWELLRTVHQPTPKAGSDYWHVTAGKHVEFGKVITKLHSLLDVPAPPFRGEGV